jgi:hypothetical protein
MKKPDINCMIKKKREKKKALDLVLLLIFQAKEFIKTKEKV